MPQISRRHDGNRLLEAADACLAAAAVRTAQLGGGPIERPDDLIGTHLQPDCLDGFTKPEIEEACDFLIRLGILARRKERRASR